MTENAATEMNARAEGWLQGMGVSITYATKDEVRCELTIGPQHLQPYSVVHGGVHCGVIESLASIGAYLFARERGQHVVGLENNTSFVRAVRAGAKLHAVARPVTRGRQTQVWQAEVLDAGEKVVATGRVRLLCLEPEQSLGGETIKGALYERKS